MRRKLLGLTLVLFCGAPAFTGASQQPAEDDALAGLIRIVTGSMEDGGNGMGALDFVSSVYESADFYESGYWGYKGETYHSDVYSGKLPEFEWSDFMRPVLGGNLTSGFGYRQSYRRMHKGVDISLNEGDRVCAALPGVVGRIGYEPGGYGHFVILVHSDGVETRYAHLSRVTAVLGQRVAAGQDIALGGNTGNSTGPHLHFEIRRHGKAFDPLSVFEM